jgi:thioredoxin reductase (NADPH)
VLLVDARDRFIWRHHVNNYLGFPDGISATDLRRRGWHQAARYGVRLMLGQVAEVAREGDGFRATIGRLHPDGFFAGRPGPIPPRDAEMASMFDQPAEGAPLPVRARTVLLATGVMGHFPEFAGRDECVGVSLFWCIHCDGFESSGKVIGVVGHDEEAAETALDLLDFTSKVTLVAGRTEGFDLPASRLDDLRANGIAAYPAAVAEYRSSGGQMEALLLEDTAHTVVLVEHVYAIQPSIAMTGIARQLGVAVDAAGQIVVNGAQETNVPGVFAAGDVTSPHNHQVTAAVHEGNEAACAINYALYRPVQKSPVDA